MSRLLKRNLMPCLLTLNSFGIKPKLISLKPSLAAQFINVSVAIVYGINIDIATECEPVFCNIVTEIYLMILRNSTSHYAIRVRTTMDAKLSTHGLRTLMLMKILSAITCHYTFKSLGKQYGLKQVIR
ncbi:hypothetical protein CDAR_504601 [Caerostris darwini]|uniref:Uncharacterized protein n=1 Tax=Caerostris darwini TaxID=1538125 RepID=A0AAV4S8Z7_9ARAC|nr:hypothetical protein CDAR_504601 [Caerostris darwini]